MKQEFTNRDRWVARLVAAGLFGYITFAFGLQGMAEPLTPWPLVAGGMLFVGVVVWFCWRLGFRLKLVVDDDEVVVVNFLRVYAVPFELVYAIREGWLTSQLVFTDGRRLPVWGVTSSMLNDLGGGADTKHSLMAEVRRAEERSRSPRRELEVRWQSELWIVPVVAAVFMGLALLRTYAL